MNYIAVSLGVIVVAFVLFFFLSFKGVNLFATVLLCTALVAMVTQEGLASIFTVFMPSVGNVFATYLSLIHISEPTRP